MPDALWIHNIDPVFITVGSFQIRYYGLFFTAAMLQGAAPLPQNGFKVELARRTLVRALETTVAGLPATGGSA